MGTSSISRRPVFQPSRAAEASLEPLGGGAHVQLCIHYKCPSSLQWLETRPERQECPVCKAGISRDKVIPLYGRGSSAQQDPR
uniref:RING-type E3 ubiquitin transferase n=1 Tax=Naja naja TaxID=35670 RepID=A0A8C6XQF2_NAJNA